MITGTPLSMAYLMASCMASFTLPHPSASTTIASAALSAACRTWLPSVPGYIPTISMRGRRSGGPPPLVWRGEIRISGCPLQGDRLHAGASLGRGSVAQGRMQALSIVKHLDVLEHRRPRLGARAKPGLMDALRLERGEEALHGRIIEAVTPPAHRLLDP